MVTAHVAILLLLPAFPVTASASTEPITASSTRARFRGTAEYFYMRNSVSLRSERRPVKKLDQLRGPSAKAATKDWKMLRRDSTLVEQQKHELRRKYLKPDLYVGKDWV